MPADRAFASDIKGKRGALPIHAGQPNPDEISWRQSLTGQAGKHGLIANLNLGGALVGFCNDCVENSAFPTLQPQRFGKAYGRPRIRAV